MMKTLQNTMMDCRCNSSCNICRMAHLSRYVYELQQGYCDRWRCARATPPYMMCPVSNSSACRWCVGTIALLVHCMCPNHAIAHSLSQSAKKTTLKTIPPNTKKKLLTHLTIPNVVTINWIATIVGNVPS